LESKDRIYRFGPFRLDAGRRVLFKGDTLLPLGGRAFEVLVALVERAGQLAGKTELLDLVWPDVAVEENNLTTQVLNLRKLLAAHDADTRYIVTDAGRGYRFVAPVSLDQPNDSQAGAEPASATPDLPQTPVAAPLVLHDGLLPTRELHNLPAEPNSFVGRAVELADISERLQGRGVLTLVGSGGVGKTRCAVRVGHEVVSKFPDGVWIVELAPLPDGGLVAEAVCRVVGAPVSGERPVVDVAVSFLRQRAMLLILDNCEHVLDGAAHLAAALVTHCPQVKILATSRQNLGIAGETVYRMPSLPLPPAGQAITAEIAMQSDAVRLFVERASDAAGGYELTDEDAPSVVSICRRLDGVAMATELAAARLRMLKPTEIAARLEDVFRLLTGGSKAALPRQQTLRATIDWSYALLSPQEQCLLRRLSVFVDGFSLEGAAAVGSGGAIDEYDVLDLLSALVDKSLVIADTAGAVTRYRMLETTRHYAREKLAESGETGVSRRLADFMAKIFARAEASWPVTPTTAWLSEFGPEVENLRAAIDWSFNQKRRPEDSGDEPGDPSIGIALVSAAGSLAEEMSLLADMRRWTAAAMPHLTDATPKARAGWILYWATRHHSVFGVRELSDLRRRAIELFRASGDITGLSCALRTAGISLVRPNEASREVLDMLSEAVSVIRPLGPTKDFANALAHVGAVQYLGGDKAVGRKLSEEALAMRRALGDQTGELVSYINLGEFAFCDGEVSVALDYAKRALAVARVSKALEVQATVLSNYANYLLAVDDTVGARAAAVEALRLQQAMCTPDYVVVTLEHLALVLALEGDAARAARLFGFTDAYYRRTEQVRDRPEQMRCDRFRKVLSGLLPEAEISVLMQEGAVWSAEQAEAAATADQIAAGETIRPLVLDASP
jgi:predicted ATPase/DNA-binding winged helix-turn-helix (wHTH) protein